MNYLDTGATFSSCKKYRYLLYRLWDNFENGFCIFIGLNPSTADENNDDPTIRRCVDFAKRFKYSGLYMLNLFGYCSTDPKELLKINDPVGKWNNKVIKEICENNNGYKICCWGNYGSFKNRGVQLINFLDHFDINLHCFGFTEKNEPKHPLYLSKESKLEKIILKRG